MNSNTYIRSIKRSETLIVAVVWLLIYASDPLYMYYLQLVNGISFSWNRIFSHWECINIFLILFLIHHYTISPLLIAQKRTSTYLAAITVCLIAFSFFIVSMERPQPQGGKMPDHQIAEMHHIHEGPRPYTFIAPPDLVRIFMAIMMISLDLGVLVWTEQQKLHQRLLMLEKQNLKQELEHLRYQINPHFFMNTLNNIHALIGIDQERAERAIVELSRLMRYSLYEGDKPLAPLQHEIDFLNLYISLMKLRFNDNVKLLFSLPSEISHEVMLPPLLLVTFVENAFKHGVSYKNPSYISILLSIDEKKRQIHFICENSRHTSVSSLKDGNNNIGLANVHKRLNLQYAKNYELIITENNSESPRFVVDLTLPFTCK